MIGMPDLTYRYVHTINEINRSDYFNIFMVIQETQMGVLCRMVTSKTGRKRLLAGS